MRGESSKMKLQKLAKVVFAFALGTVMAFPLPVYAESGQITKKVEINTEQSELATQRYGKEADLVISSARELKEFAQYVSNGNNYEGKLIKLTQDIQFDGVTVNNFTSIGNPWKEFQGTFDGCGYTISGIQIMDRVGVYQYTGLFGAIGSNGTVKNVTIKDSYISGDNVTGGICALNRGAIDNCHNYNAEVVGKDDAGGIAAQNEGTITNCSSTGKVSSTCTANSGSASVGGISGVNEGQIYNSCNRGEILSDSQNSYTSVSGVAGNCHGNGAVVENCYNTGKIIATSLESRYYGGIVGYVEGIVANSYCSRESVETNFGTVKGTDRNNKSLSESEMQQVSFTDQLNSNRGSHTNWLEWENRKEESEYPVTAKRINISDCQISLENNQMEYEGIAQMPEVVVTYDGLELQKDVDYILGYCDNINVGEASVVITGLGKYMDSETYPFEIMCRDISKAEVNFDTAHVVYDGTEKTPNPSVRDQGRLLAKDIDYTITYKNNINAGTAQIIVTGKGNYAKSVIKPFNIKKAEQNISCMTSCKKGYGESPFNLNVKRITGNGTLTYASSDQKVVTVGSTGKVTIKGVGRAVITVNAVSNTNYNKKTVKVNVEVCPAQQKITSLKSAKAKTITVKWKKDLKASGYILQYSTDKRFRKNVKTVTISNYKTTSKRISKLKSGNRYYVRICSYKKISGAKMQGKNSVIDSVIVKK